MGRRPKEESRTALDAIRAHHEAMTWQERRRKSPRPTGPTLPSAAFNKAYFSPFSSRVENLDLKVRPNSTFRRGDKWFRDVDKPEVFECDMTDFLAELAKGAIFTDVFGEDGFSFEPKFLPYSDEHVRQAMDDPAEAAYRLRAWQMAWSHDASGRWSGPTRDFLANSR